MIQNKVSPFLGGLKRIYHFAEAEIVSLLVENDKGREASRASTLASDKGNDLIPLAHPADTMHTDKIHADKRRVALHSLNRFCVKPLCQTTAQPIR